MEKNNAHPELLPYTQYLLYTRGYSSKTADAYIRDIVFFLDYLKKEAVEPKDVDEPVIVGYLSFQIRSRHVSRRTLQRRLSALRSYYDYLHAHDRENYAINPFRLISAPKGETKYPRALFPNEVAKLLDENAKRDDPLMVRDQAILELLYASGMRASEIVGLEPSAIDFRTKTIRVYGKGKKYRLVPFGQNAEAWMKRYQTGLRAELLAKQPDAVTSRKPRTFFLNAQGKNLTTRGLEFILHRIEERTGLSLDLHPHELRHSFATHLLENGADLRLIQELLGHETINTTQVYTHITQKDMKDQYEACFPKRTGKKPDGTDNS